MAAAALAAGCATVVLEGPEGLGASTAAGRARALTSARRSRALLSSPLPFTLDVAGSEESFQWDVPEAEVSEALLEQRGGLWVASGGGAAQSGHCEALRTESAEVRAVEVDEALSRAQTQAARRLAREAVSAPEGRFRGALVVVRRRVEARGRSVQVTLTGCVAGARAQALLPVDACRLALTGLARRSDDASRWQGLAVRCPSSMGDAVEEAVRRQISLDSAGRKALAEGLLTVLDKSVSVDPKPATRPMEAAPRADGSSTAVQAHAASTPAATSVSVVVRASPVTVSPATASHATTPPTTTTPIVPAPTTSVSGGVVVNVTVNAVPGTPAPSAAAPAGSPASPPQARCPAGAVLIAAPSKSAESPSFCLDRTETSEKSYRGRGSQRPATSVSWCDAAAFCAKHAGRLPTEAEWVRAAMGDGARDYPWGSAAPTCDRVNTNACEGVTRFVDAAGDVTPGGVVGLGGNVSEWTADAWSGVPGARVVRGGAFDKPASSTSNAFRTGRDWNESYRDGALGFRCAYDVTFE